MQPQSFSSSSSQRQNLRTIENGIAEYELTIDHIHMMLHQEVTTYPCCENYVRDIDLPKLRCLRSKDVKGTINDEWRQKICEWAFEVVDHFEYSREVVSLTMNYLDRYMSHTLLKGTPLSRKEFQLAAIACIHIAVKITGSFKTANKNNQTLSILMLVKLSSGRFSKESIMNMERQILSDLSWRLTPPTVTRFIHHFMLLFPTNGANGAVPEHMKYEIFEVARYLSELSVCTSSITIERKASIVAFASLLNAMECTNMPFLHGDIHSAFINVIAYVTQLCPISNEVNELREELKALCPTYFHIQQDIPENNEEARKSPVCVSGHSGGRKRSRISV